MFYLQLYFIAGVLYTFVMYDYFYKGIKQDFIRNNYTLYSLNPRECNTVIKFIPVLFVFVWPINVVMRFINYVKR